MSENKKLPIKITKEEIAQFCQRHHICKLSLFSSVLRDDFTPESDIQNETINLEQCKHLPLESLSKYKKHTLFQGDLVIATVGSHPTQPGSVVGRPGIVPQHAQGALLNQNAVRIAPNNNYLDKKYLAYLGKSQFFRNYIIRHARGSANQVRMSIGLLKEMEVLLPPLPLQGKIAAILSAYDDLIENNTRRIEILEEMARSLYREWFVNFRFPGHEQVKLVDSELELIPEGWEVKKVTDAVWVNPTTKVPKEGDKPFVPMTSLSNNSMLINNIESRSGNSGAKFKNGDTLFARITPCLENGKTGYVQFLPSNNTVAFGSTEFIVLRSKTLCPEYVYLTARSDEFRDNAIKSMSGATGRQRVQETCFERFIVAHPDSKTLTKFSEIVSLYFCNIYVLRQKNNNLRQTRDLLLPKLISGEIDVENLDINTEEIAA